MAVSALACGVILSGGWPLPRSVSGGKLCSAACAALPAAVEAPGGPHCQESVGVEPCAAVQADDNAAINRCSGGAGSGSCSTNADAAEAEGRLQRQCGPAGMTRLGEPLAELMDGAVLPFRAVCSLSGAASAYPAQSG